MRPSIPTATLLGLAVALSLAAQAPAVGAQTAPAAAGTEPGDAIEVRPLRGLRAEAATLLIQGQAGGSLPVALFAGAPDSQGRIELVAELAFEAWPPVRTESETGDETSLAETESDPRELEVFAYVVDSSNAVLAHLQEVIVLPGDFTLAKGRDGVRYVGQLTLPSGYQPSSGDSVRLLVLDPERRLFQLEPTALGDEALGLPIPTFASQARWREVRSTQTSVAGSAPSLRNVLAPGRTELTLDPRPDYPEEQLVVFVRGPRGVDRTRDLASTVRSRAGDQKLVLDIEVPAELRGLFELAVAKREPSTGRRSRREAKTTQDQEPRLALVSRPTEVWLPGADESGSTTDTTSSGPSDSAVARLTWPAVLRRDPTITRRVSAEELAERELETQLATAYRNTLRESVNARPSDIASVLLAGVEERAVADPKLLEVLGPAQARVELELIRNDPSSGIALLALHWRAYQQHRDAGRLHLAGQHRRLALALAASMKSAAPPEELLDSAAYLLSSFAELLLGYGSWLEAGQALDVAVELAPRHATARFFAALVAEKRGQYQVAADHIEQAAAADASSPWTRVSSRRSSRSNRTDATGTGTAVRPCSLVRTTPRSVSWPLSSRPRRLAEDGEIQAAIRALQRCLSSFPESRPLLLQLARLHERSGNPSRAAALIERWRLAPLDDQPSARHQYSSLPTEMAEELHERSLTLERIYGPSLLASLGS